MNLLSKTILLSFLLCLYTQCIYSQELMLKALQNLSICIEKINSFLKSGQTTDDIINKQKAKEMAVELDRQIGVLITAKTAIVYMLENKSHDTAKYIHSVKDIEESLKHFKITLNRYDNLISAAGINSMQLKNSLSVDILKKEENLHQAERILKGNKFDQEPAKKVTDYLNNCITILHHTDSTLAKFKP